MTKCIYCNKTMPSIGTDRKNGKTSFFYSHDWEARKYHKTCFKKINGLGEGVSNNEYLENLKTFCGL